jgi:diguanylate cyclase (GGDEF)-like protein
MAASPSFSSTEIAYVMVSAQQLVLGIGWIIGSRLMPSTRVAALHWAGCALLTALSLTLYVVGAQYDSAGLRLAGNTCVTLTLIALQRGVWHFYGARLRWGWHATVLVLALGASWFGMADDHRSWRMAVLSALLSGLCLSTAWDLQALAGGARQRRFGLAVAAPLALGGVVFALRAGRALLMPPGAVQEVSADTLGNFIAAFVYVVITLTFQLSLLALVFSRLVAELQRTSRRDALTGVMNRRALDEALEDEEHRAQRLDAPFAVLMIDADHFKGINDRFGHAAGDRALQHLAALMGAQMRDIDRLGRYGGEEFLALLPGTGLEAARAAGERVRERVQAVPLMWQEAPLPLTVSVGIAAWRGKDDALAVLLARADAALYAAKRAGRNRVQVAGG